MKVAALLATRATRAHRKAWTAVFAALTLTSLLLGAFGLTLVSAWSAHPRVERYAGADLVVAGDQTTRFSAASLGERETVSAGLTERVRIPRTALTVVRGVPGVRAAVADVEFPVGLAGSAATESATESATASATGRPWEAARLASYALRTGRAPQRADEVVVAGGGGPERGGADRVGQRLTLRVGGHDTAYTVVGVADGPRTAVWFTDAEARRLSGHPEALDAIGVVAESGTGAGELAGRVRKALDTAGVTDVGHRADGDPATVRVLTGDDRGEAEFLAAAPARGELLAALGSVAGAVVLVSLLVVSSTIVQALRQRSHELGLLRAVGATPGQLRAAVGREVGRVAAWAALVGAAGAAPAYLGLRA
ncbi:ABC transporter permease, partial [Streptomyces sp. SID8382]|nr:ABC transporter permease [Streptomyces sp. SID8382]